MSEEENNVERVIDKLANHVQKIFLVDEQYELYKNYTMSASTIYSSDTKMAINITEKALEALKMAQSRKEEFFGEDSV